MRTKTWFTILLLLFCAAPVLAQKVVETDDIESFLEDNPEKTRPAEQILAQQKKEGQRVPHKIFSLGLGFNFGVFIGDDMKDVNNHIHEKINEDSWTLISQGDSDMYLNMVPRLTVNIMPLRYLMIQVLGEVGWGPKIVTELVGETYSFHFMRYSPGLVLNGYLPLGSTGKYSLFAGGGAFYHFFTFGKYEAQGFGGRAQLGLRIDWNTLGLEIFAAYDYAVGETGKYNEYIDKKMTLDYSSVLFGINLYFKII